MVIYVAIYENTDFGLYCNENCRLTRVFTQRTNVDKNNKAESIAIGILQISRNCFPFFFIFLFFKYRFQIDERIAQVTLTEIENKNYILFFFSQCL